MAENQYNKKKGTFLKTVAGIGATMLAYAVGSRVFGMGISKANSMLGRFVHKSITAGQKVFSARKSPLGAALARRGNIKFAKRLFESSRLAEKGNKVFLSSIAKNMAASNPRDTLMKRAINFHKKQMQTSKAIFGEQGMFQPFSRPVAGAPTHMTRSIVGTKAYSYGTAMSKSLPFWYVYSAIGAKRRGEKIGAKEILANTAMDVAFRGGGAILKGAKKSVGSWAKLALAKNPKIAKGAASALGSFSESVMKQMYAFRHARARTRSIGTDVIGKKGLRKMLAGASKGIKRTKTFTSSYLSAMTDPMEQVRLDHMKSYSVMGRAHAMLKGKVKGPYNLGKFMDKIFQDTVAPDVYSGPFTKQGPGMYSPSEFKYNGTMGFFKETLKNVNIGYASMPKIMGKNKLPMDPDIYMFQNKLIDMKLMKPSTWFYGAFRAVSSTLRLGGKPLTRILGIDEFVKPKNFKKFDDMYMLGSGKSFSMGYKPNPQLRESGSKDMYLSLFGLVDDASMASSKMSGDDLKRYSSLKSQVLSGVEQMGTKEYMSFMDHVSKGIYQIPEGQAFFSTGKKMYMMGELDDSLFRFGSKYSYTGNKGDLNTFYEGFGSRAGNALAKATQATLFKDSLAKRKKPGPFKTIFRRINAAMQMNESPNMSIYEEAYKQVARWQDVGDYYPLYRTVLQNRQVVEDLVTRQGSSAISNDFNLASLQREVMPRIKEDATGLSLEMLNYIDDAAAMETSKDSLEALKRIKLGEGKIKNREYSLYDFMTSMPQTNNPEKVQQLDDMLQLLKSSNEDILTKDSAALIDDILSSGIDSNFLSTTAYKGLGGKLDVSSSRAVRAFVMRDYMAKDFSMKGASVRSSEIRNFLGGMKREARIDHFNEKLIQTRMYGVAKGGDDLQSFIRAIDDTVTPMQRGSRIGPYGGPSPTMDTGIDDYIKFLDSQHKMLDVGWGRNPYIDVPDYMSNVNRYNIITGTSERGAYEAMAGVENTPSANFGFFDELTKSVRGIDEDMVTYNGAMIKSSLNAINTTASYIGMGMAESDVTNINAYFGSFIRKKILPAVGVFGAYKVLDTLTDESQLFEQTALGDGVGVFAGSMLVKSRLAAHKLFSWGDGRLADNLEEKFPGIISSPASGVVRGLLPFMAGPSIGFKMGGVSGAAIGGITGAAVSLLAGGGPLGLFGMYDISKSRDELLAEYSGQKDVAVRKGRFWELSSGSFLGDQIDYYRPSWYAKLTSQYKYTPDFLGSKGEQLMSYMDPNHYAKKNYSTRPYPYSSGVLSDVPFMGNALAFGRQEMYDMSQFESQSQAFVDNMYAGDTGGNAMPADLAATESLSASNSIMDGTKSQNFPTVSDTDSYLTTQAFGDIGAAQLTNTHTPMPVNQSDIASRLSSQTYYTTEMFGLRGFAMNQAVTGGLGVDTQSIAGYMPEYESSGYAYSARRAYWDQNLGGLGGQTEFVRRVLPRRVDDHRYVNPLRNVMPTWMPGNENFIDFQTGDPYAAISEGELRLPGWGYLASHDVSLDPPADIDHMGLPVSESIASYLGMKETMGDQRMRDHLSKQRYIDALYTESFNTGQSARKNVIHYDKSTNVLGTVDVEVDNVAHKVYALSQKEFEESQSRGYNEYIKKGKALATISKKPVNVVIINSDTGENKSVSVQADNGILQTELKKFSVVRTFLQQNYPSFLGNPDVNMNDLYSVVDRFSILADVAPYSSQYNDYYKIVMELLSAGKLTPKEVEKVYTSLKQREAVTNKMEFKDEKTMWNNVTGGTDPLSSKLINNMDSIQAYKKYRLFGDKVKMWNTPVASFIKPGIHSTLGEDKPVQAAVSKAMFLTPFYGPTVGIASAAVAGSIASANAVTGNTYIPEERKREHEIDFQRQILEYQKNKMLHAQTGNRLYEFKAQNSNIYGAITEKDELTEQDLLRVVSSPDKPYLRSFARLEDENRREESLQYLPVHYRAALKKHWGEDITNEVNEMQGTANEILKDTPDDFLGYSADIDLKDLEVQDMMNEGLNARHMGMGWHSQLYKMQYNKTLPGGLRDFQHGAGISASDLQNTISSFLSGSQVTVIPMAGNDNVVINVQIGGF